MGIPASAEHSEWLDDREIRRLPVRSEAIPLPAAIRDRPAPAAPRAPRVCPHAPRDIAPRFAGGAPDSCLDAVTLLLEIPSLLYLIVLLNSRRSQALAKCQSRLAVRGEICMEVTISSSVNPPK